MKRSTTKKACLLFALLCFFCCNPWAWAKNKEMSKNIPVSVEAIKVATTTWQPTFESTGTLIADQGITVKSDIPGRITKIFFKSGQYVKQGTPLIQIFPDILQQQLRAAKIALKLAANNFERYAKLRKAKGAITQENYYIAASDYNKIRALVEQTEVKLKQSLIKAPFSGYLGIRKVSLGDYLTAGQVIVNLEDTDPIYVDFSVPEIYSKQVQIGQRLQVSSQAYGTRIFTGTVLAMDSLINPNTRTLEIRAVIPNEDNFLIPGSFIKVVLYIGKKQQVISIPQTSIIYSNLGNYVYKVVKNKAIKTIVTLGMRDTKNINVIKGLMPGDVIVSIGSQKLTDGALVKWVH